MCYILCNAPVFVGVVHEFCTGDHVEILVLWVCGKLLGDSQSGCTAHKSYGNICGMADSNGLPEVVGTSSISGSVGVASALTAVTNESNERGEVISSQQLYDRMMHWYNDGVHVDPDDHETGKVRNITRKILFKGLKFCTGEGRPTTGSLKQRAEKFVVGKCHERPDLTKGNYANHLMTKCGFEFKGTYDSITCRTKWWKTYQHCVRNEIRSRRSQVNSRMRALVTQGKVFLVISFFI